MPIFGPDGKTVIKEFLGERPAKDTDLLPVERATDVGLDDLRYVCETREEIVVIEELMRRRDLGIKVTELTPDGIRMMKRLTERVRSHRRTN